MEKIHKKYSNGEITIHWYPDLCCHSGICVYELPQVFDVTKRPWINVHAASTKELIKTVNNCPSGALTFTYDNEEK